MIQCFWAFLSSQIGKRFTFIHSQFVHFSNEGYLRYFLQKYEIFSLFSGSIDENLNHWNENVRLNYSKLSR